MAVAEEGTVNVAVLANNSVGSTSETGQMLTITAASALHGSVVIESDGTLTYTPTTDFYGTDTLTYTITDDGTTNGVAAPLTASGTISVTVTAVDDAPVATADSATVTQDGSVILSVLANDTDADNRSPTAANTGLTVTAVTQGTYSTVTFTSGDVTYFPKSGFSGSDTFAYTREDATGLSSMATVSVTIAANTTAGGATALDNDHEALVALLAEWLQNAPLADRVKRITEGFGSANLHKLSATDSVLADTADLRTTGGGGTITRYTAS